MALSYYSPGAENRGAHSELWKPLRFIGDFLADNNSDTPRAALVIGNFARHIRRSRNQPSPLNDAIRTIINTAHGIDPTISRLRVTRHLPGSEAEIWSLHTDVTLGTPRKQLDGSWKVATNTHAGLLRFMAIDGEAPLATKGMFIEDGPVLKAHFIHLPDTLVTVDDATRAAHKSKEALYEEHPETITGHDGQIIRWRFGETALQETVQYQTVEEGELMELSPRTIHIPPFSQADGRVFLHLS